VNDAVKGAVKGVKGVKDAPLTEIIAKVLIDACDWLTMREIADRIEIAPDSTCRTKMEVIATALTSLECAGRVAVVRKRRPYLFCAGTTEGCDPHTIRVLRYPDPRRLSDSIDDLLYGREPSP
jgi:hypothetical protein